MRHLQVVLRDYVDRGKGASLSDVEGARRAMDDAITAYLQLPNDERERQLWADILHAKDALNSAVDRCLMRPEGSGASTADLMRDVSTAADALSGAITRDIELNASRAHGSALGIEQTYARARALASVMALLCVAITVLGAVGLRRGFREHTELARKHRMVVEERASELEAFAGRVAHDILSPLGVVNMAMRAASTATNEATRAQMADRGSAAIKRIDRLVNGLLAFAVAGAKPDPDARADVALVVEEVSPELRAAAAEAKVDLTMHVDVQSAVACNPGVLASVISNLAQNAIKYVASSEVRVVEVRAMQRRDVVRIEVADTGPGLPPGLEAHVFEPYVRGKNEKARGIGLGLATVKRIADAHGGAVGVVSRPGSGCTFWVELPAAA
jgi:signal transduction histidine kinase